MPPLPMMRRTPVFSMNSFSKSSMRIEVVGPIATTRQPLGLVSSFVMMGPPWKIAPSLMSTGNSRPNFTTRVCAQSRAVMSLPVK